MLKNTTSPEDIWRKASVMRGMLDAVVELSWWMIQAERAPTEQCLNGLLEVSSQARELARELDDVLSEAAFSRPRPS